MIIIINWVLTAEDGHLGEGQRRQREGKGRGRKHPGIAQRVLALLSRDHEGGRRRGRRRQEQKRNEGNTCPLFPTDSNGQNPGFGTNPVLTLASAPFPFLSYKSPLSSLLLLPPFPFIFLSPLTPLLSSSSSLSPHPSSFFLFLRLFLLLIPFILLLSLLSPLPSYPFSLGFVPPILSYSSFLHPFHNLAIHFTDPNESEKK